MGQPEEPEEEESIWKRCCFCILDCLATVFRTLAACWFAIKWMTKRSCYPVKETCIGSWDKFSRWYHPYRVHKPTATVPSFQFGGVEV
mmetsp:Transcript_28875/g.62867  ORF Transcript_28875/g.62867 Transcript_28875/m.62867 type:complete len:88 (+) Transcript_28875:121-384(+)